MDRDGNIGIGYSFGGAPNYPGQRFTGRLAKDPPGQMSLGETVLADGEAAQNAMRWEDYTQTAMDPSDDRTIWYVGDYLKKGASGYSSRIGAFRLQTPKITPITPPEQDFFDKKTDYQGIPIKAPKVVADEALFEARRRMDKMLEKMPNAVKNLVAAGAELHIIGKDQVTSDLPEFRHMKGKPFQGKPTEKVTTIDERTRGMGGLKFSCGEENLLKLPKDRYLGRDICVHEFAHTLQNYGLSRDVQEKITAQYKASTGKGLWKGAYAASDRGEFFAELTMWYFGTHGDTPPGIPAPGRDAFKAYDPEAFQLLDDIYSGRLAVSLRRNP